MQPSRKALASRFAAIDFETADNGADSACAVGVVVVEGVHIVARHRALLRPPRRRFVYTDIHGLRWSDVAGEPTFAEHWNTLRPLLEGVRFVAAHNAVFDAGVLRACCKAARVLVPVAPFRCTVRLARNMWGIHPTRLPDVCDFLGIALDHHEALSDAEACARIVIAARLERRRQREHVNETQAGTRRRSLQHPGSVRRGTQSSSPS